MASQSATFTVTVKGGTPPPPPPPALTLTPTGGALPDETVGTPVTDLVTVVSGGTPPYDFAVSNGALPDGLSLNATTNTDGSETLSLEGTPTTAGDYAFDITVSDAAGASAVVPAVRKVG